MSQQLAQSALFEELIGELGDAQMVLSKMHDSWLALPWEFEKALPPEIAHNGQGYIKKTDAVDFLRRYMQGGGDA